MGQKLSRVFRYSDNDNCFNVTNSHNNIVNVNTIQEDESLQILQWLSTLGPEKRHQELQANRLEGVGNWLLETDAFQGWGNREDTSSQAVLFCHGDPGVGKTFISSLVIDTLCHQAEGADTNVIGLYCDFLHQKEQSTTNMLGAILKQLISRGNIPEYILEAFRRGRDWFGGGCLGRPDLLKMLKWTIQTQTRVFICIDGLDECLPDHRVGLLESLRELSRESPGVRIFLAGRTHVKDEVAKYFTGVHMIHIVPAQDDIKIYLEMKLGRDTELDAMDDSLRRDIMKDIPKSISEIFLLVSLKMDSILGEATIHQRRKKLAEVTSEGGVGDAYSATLQRLRAQTPSRARLGMDTLMWVAHSERPLQEDELCYAMGVEKECSDFNSDNVPSIRTLLSCSLGLVTLDSTSSTVRLVHFTLQEYLYANPTLFDNPHSMIAEVCLTYLNSQCIKDLSTTTQASPPTALFTQYASCYWGSHARKGMTECVKSLALDLLGQYHHHIFPSIVLTGGGDLPPHPDGAMILKGFTELHCIALFGISEIVIHLLETGDWDVNGRDTTGSTPLTWAAIRGHDQVVEILLSWRDINPNIRDIQGRTPLFWAAGMGHERIVKMFLDRIDIDANSSEYESGKTPFLWAAANGFEGIVKMFLDRDLVNPNMTDNTGRTSVSWAAAGGCDSVLEILLDYKDTRPDVADSAGRTPTSWAVENECAGALEILLKRQDVNPNIGRYGSGQTPLLWAAENGHERLARILLSRGDVDPNMTDDRGRTPISWAAKNGHEGVVKLLLACGEADLEIADNDYGRTPLLWATKRGHGGVVEILLERADINSNTRDSNGRTPLSWAASMGHEKVVGMFLSRRDVDACIPEYESGRTPFSYATGNGCDGVVKMFLDRDDIDPNVEDNTGRTPILLAASRGCERVVKILLSHNDVKPDIADHLGRTATSLATQNGHRGILEALLKRQDVNPETTRNESGQTPLLWAAENGHEGVVKILLCRKDVDPNMTDVLGRSPLSWAAENGREEVVRMLLSHKDINLNIAENDSGRTPLLWAAENGHTGVVKLLLAQKYINPDRPENHFGQTPLSWAAENGHEEVVKILLARKDVGHDRKDNFNRTPLSLAAENGRVGVVGVLLESGDVNPNTSGITPLMRAAGNGHEEVVRILLGQKDIKPDIGVAQTALSLAARNGRTGVVRILLERDDVDVNRKDYNGRTPLLWAAFRGCAGVVKVLLARGDIDTDAADTRYNLTPLSWAALGGREGAVRVLYKHDDSVSYTEDDSVNHHPFNRATGDEPERVTVQLDQEDVSRMFPGYGSDFMPIPGALDKPRRSSSLLIAALKAPGELVTMLRKLVNPNPGETRFVPGSLVWNVEDEYAEVVKMLLDHLDSGEKPPKADPESDNPNLSEGDASNRALTPPPAHDEQFLVPQSKSPEPTEKSRESVEISPESTEISPEPAGLFSDWRFVVIFVLLYWVWAFA